MAAESELEDKRPASRRVADDLLQRIDAGEFPLGSSLPTYRQLASDYEVAVNTALAAVRLLRDSGAATIRPNAGAQVRDRTTTLDLAAALSDIRAEMAALRSKAQHISTELAGLEERLSILAAQLDAPQE